jgi:general secretion pathway protein N
LIRSKRGLIATAVITFLIGLIVMFPARVAVHWFVPANIAITGIEGSAWSGQAGEASFGAMYCKDLKWEINALRLFVGELSYRISVTPVSGFLETDIAFAAGGGVSLSQLTASLPLEIFEDVAAIRGLQGSASFDFERVEIVDNLAVVADGVLQVADITIPIIARDSLGGYRAEFFTQNNGITASIEDTDGVLDMAGSIQVRKDRSFEFIGQVVVQPNTPESIRQQLQFLPPPNEHGQQEIRLEGVL